MNEKALIESIRRLSTNPAFVAALRKEFTPKSGAKAAIDMGLIMTLLPIILQLLSGGFSPALMAALIEAVLQIFGEKKA